MPCEVFLLCPAALLSHLKAQASSLFITLQEFNRGLFDFLIATDEASKPEAKPEGSSEAAAMQAATATTSAGAEQEADAEAEPAAAEEDPSHPWAAAAVAEAAEQGEASLSQLGKHSITYAPNLSPSVEQFACYRMKHPGHIHPASPLDSVARTKSACWTSRCLSCTSILNDKKHSHKL